LPGVAKTATVSRGDEGAARGLLRILDAACVIVLTLDSRAKNYAASGAAAQETNVIDAKNLFSYTLVVERR
jgi:hypothetical protein